MPFTPKTMRETFHSTFYSSFSQDKYLQGKIFGSKGTCAAFVVKWIKDDYHGLDFSGSFVGKTDGMEEVMSFFMLQQTGRFDVMLKNLAVVGLFKKDEGFLPSHGMKISVNLTRLGLMDIGYYFIGITNNIHGFNGNIEGHALGFKNAGGIFKFFDPNFGTVEFATFDHAKTFIKNFAQRVYDDLNGDVLWYRFAP